MAEFLEERLPVGIRMGAVYGDDYNVEITETSSGSEYRRLVHAFPRRVFDISYIDHASELWDSIISLYHRVYGKYAGFRVKAWDDYTTNNRVGTPTAFDQELAVVTAGSVYQLQVTYGTGGTSISLGLPVRTIFKPVAGTVLAAIGTEDQRSGAYSVDTTTGQITFAANKNYAITGITQASQAVLTIGAHTLVVADTVHIGSVSGMTQINDMRGTVVAIGATTITVNIDSTLFSAYTSGGKVNTRPQTGETVYGGCEFDIPCRFNGRPDVISRAADIRETGSFEIIELLNP